MLLVDAEDDGLVEAVGLLEEVREVLRDGLGARAQRETALEVRRVIFLVGNLAAQLVEFALGRPPAGRVRGCDDAMHAVGREEAVVDALAQAVLVDRVAEIAIGRLLSSRSGVAVMPSWTAGSKYSRISRQFDSSLALPRWHSSTMMRSKKSRAYSL